MSSFPIMILVNSFNYLTLDIELRYFLNHVSVSHHPTLPSLIVGRSGNYRIFSVHFNLLATPIYINLGNFYLLPFIATPPQIT